MKARPIPASLAGIELIAGPLVIKPDKSLDVVAFPIEGNRAGSLQARQRVVVGGMARFGGFLADATHSMNERRTILSQDQIDSPCLFGFL